MGTTAEPGTVGEADPGAAVRPAGSVGGLEEGAGSGGGNVIPGATAPGVPAAGCTVATGDGVTGPRVAGALVAGDAAAGAGVGVDGQAVSVRARAKAHPVKTNRLGVRIHARHPPGVFAVGKAGPPSYLRGLGTE
ncbi:MAG: hypothetical protein ACYC3S_13755 [Chloroflexota bacterium]